MNKKLFRKAQKIIKILEQMKMVDVAIEERYARIIGRVDAKGTADIGVYMHLITLESGGEKIIYSINGGNAMNSFRKLCGITKSHLKAIADIT